MKFDVATHEHEDGLRSLCRDTITPGWIRLAFAREPDFFLGLGVQGTFNEVAIAVQDGRVVGMGCRSIRPAWVNGRITDIGYLGGLRLSPEIRRTGALGRLFAASRMLHQRHPVPVYLTTVMESNIEAMRLLTSRRAGLPHYLDHGRYTTYAININRRGSHAPHLNIRRGDEMPLDLIIEFMHRHGASRQFFPVIRPEYFGTGYLLGLSPSDFRVALGGDGAIIGVAAMWDQSPFKQNVVAGYAPPFRLARPVLNGALRLLGFRPLPKPGTALKASYIAFCCTANNDARILRAILAQIHTDHQSGDCHFLVAGFHERDPLRAAVRGFLAFRTVSRFYLVCLDEDLDFVRNLDAALVPHLDVAVM